MASVDWNGSYYDVNLDDGSYFSFDEEEADIEQIDRTIEAYRAWRAYVIAKGLDRNE